MFSMSSLLESRNCVLHLRTMLDLQRIQKKVSQTKTGCNLYPRHGKTEVQREYHKACQRCCKKVDSQGEHFTGIHDRFLRDPVYRESQLAIGWTEQKCKEWDGFAKQRPYISSHSRGKEKIPRTMVSHLEQVRQKWAYETSIRFSSCCLDQKSSTPRVRRTS